MGVLTLTLGLCLSLLLVVRGWRTVLALLAVVLLGTVGLTSQSLPVAIGSAPAGLILAMDLTTALTAMGILAITGLKNHRSATAHHSSAQGFSWRGLGGSLSAIAVVLLLTMSLPAWGTSTVRVVDFAWTLLIVSGHVLIVRASGLLDVGVGLTVLLFGLKLLYVALIIPIGVVELGVLNLAVILAALILAYADGVLSLQSDADASYRTK